MAREIKFEIDDELEGHLLALAENWEKDPVELAKALFAEELMGQTSGSRGVPHSRRYWYRNSDVYFTAEERERLQRKWDAYWESPEGKAIMLEHQKDRERLFKKMPAREAKDG